MPELPDVEVFRRTVAHSSLHRPITGVDARDPQVLDGISARRLTEELIGVELAATLRRGKQLYVRCDSGAALAMHFGMTAYVDPGATADPTPEHTRLTLFLDDRRLAFVDQRRFGRVGLVDDPDRNIEERGLGPDALDLGATDLQAILDGSRGSLVATLMDQSSIAGIGNIYSDEILFHARLDPQAPARGLTDAESGRLHRQLRRVLERAIEAHAQPDRMPRGWLIHAREDGAPCPRGNGTVRRYSASGRHAYWCPDCQR